MKREPGLIYFNPKDGPSVQANNCSPAVSVSLPCWLSSKQEDATAVDEE